MFLRVFALLGPLKSLKSETTGVRGVQIGLWEIRMAKTISSLWLNRCSMLGPSPKLFEYFIHLREIILTECDWDLLPNNIEYLKSLIILRIQYCLHIQSLPVLPQSLKRIEFWGCECDEAFMRSCETRGEPNWHKIKHIPSVCFEGKSSCSHGGVHFVCFLPLF